MNFLVAGVAVFVGTNTNVEKCTGFARIKTGCTAITANPPVYSLWLAVRPALPKEAVEAGELAGDLAVPAEPPDQVDAHITDRKVELD